MLTVETFDSLSEADRSMRERTRYLGGGTLVMREVNYGDSSFDRIVRSRDPGLRRIGQADNVIEIGAGATMADIVNSQTSEFLGPVAQSVGGPAVRNMATIGGNLFAPNPYGDLTVALLALGASIRFADGTTMEVEQFLTRRSLVRGLVASVKVSRPETGEFRFSKVSRVKPKGVSVMSIAARLPMRSGRVHGARVAFGSMGPVPLRAKGVESALEGATLDEPGISSALRVATDGLDPADDALASAWYRREVARVHLKRLLLGSGR